MKNRSLLVIILVGVALLGFVACSVYIFYMGFSIRNGNSEPLNPALMYVASGLTGLVGGIVAAGFGVEVPQTDPQAAASSRSIKLQRLGSLTSQSSKSEQRELFGFIYALTYIVVGLAAVFVWVWLNDDAIPIIANMAMTFLGMAIPIAGSFFNGD